MGAQPNRTHVFITFGRVIPRFLAYANAITGQAAQASKRVKHARPRQKLAAVHLPLVKE
jgi:hypothetical protein